MKASEWRSTTRAWSDCRHNAWTHGIVLDPFGGVGRTGVAALKLGRHFIGIDLYQEYAAIAKQRFAGVVNELARKGLNPWTMER